MIVGSSQLAEARFPWLATNVTRDGALLEGAADYVVREIGGVKVGFFGLVTPETTRLSSPGPGVAFGPLGEGFVRISFAAPVEQIGTGIERMGRYLRALGR